MSGENIYIYGYDYQGGIEPKLGEMQIAKGGM